MVNSWPINTTEGALIYLLDKGYFVKPPYSHKDQYQHRTSTNGCIWVANEKDLVNLLEGFRKLKYN